MPEEDLKSKCFIAMPVRTRKVEADQYGDPDHWKHVMEELFVPAIIEAGYEPVIPVTTGAYLIHAQIVKHLSECELMLCDLSGHNPNVFFELGVRTSLNLPIALVHDGSADLPFDTSGINTSSYGPRLNAWEIADERARLADHIVMSAASCGGQNPMWQQFGLNLKAQEPTSAESPLEAKLDVLMQEVSWLRHRGGALPSRARSFMRTSGALGASPQEVEVGARAFAALAEEKNWAVSVFVDPDVGDVVVSADRPGVMNGYVVNGAESLGSRHGVRFRLAAHPSDDPTEPMWSAFEFDVRQMERDRYRDSAEASSPKVVTRRPFGA